MAADAEVEVEAILRDELLPGGERRFMVRRGFGPEEDTWEPPENLGGARALLAKYIEAAARASGAEEGAEDGPTLQQAEGTGNAPTKRARGEPAAMAVAVAVGPMPADLVHLGYALSLGPSPKMGEGGDPPGRFT